MKIGIIGGGTMGLTLALRLSRQGQRVTVFEAAPQAGGLATWFDYGDFVWDKYYHVALGKDEHLKGLISDLGLAPKFKLAETKTGFLWNGRHLSMSNHWEFLTFPALSLIDKARLGLGIMRATRIEDAGPLERITSAEWLTKLFGKSVYAAIWEPLLESKYGVLKDEVPATIMWATIKRYYSTRNKGDGKEMMGFLSGGLKTMFDALAAEIARGGGVIHCATPVESVRETPDGRVQIRAGRETHEFDRVISTLPTSIFRKVAPEMPELFGETKSRPKFLGIVCMALVLKRPLSPYYVTNLIQKGFPFTGIIGVTNLTGPEEHGGKHLVMLPRYDVPESSWFDKPAEEVARIFLAALRPTWPDIHQNLVRYFVNREKLVQALWLQNPPALMGPGKSRSGCVWNVNAELAGRDTLNNNAIVGVADRAAAEFLESIGRESAGGHDIELKPQPIAVGQ